MPGRGRSEYDYAFRWKRDHLKRCQYENNVNYRSRRRLMESQHFDWSWPDEDEAQQSDDDFISSSDVSNAYLPEPVKSKQKEKEIDEEEQEENEEEQQEKDENYPRYHIMKKRKSTYPTCSGDKNVKLSISSASTCSVRGTSTSDEISNVDPINQSEVARRKRSLEIKNRKTEEKLEDTSEVHFLRDDYWKRLKAKVVSKAIDKVNDWRPNIEVDQQSHDGAGLLEHVGRATQTQHKMTGTPATDRLNSNCEKQPIKSKVLSTNQGKLFSHFGIGSREEDGCKQTFNVRSSVDVYPSATRASELRGLKKYRSRDTKEKIINRIHRSLNDKVEKERDNCWLSEYRKNFSSYGSIYYANNLANRRPLTSRF